MKNDASGFTRRSFLKTSALLALPTVSGCLTRGSTPYARFAVISDTHVSGEESRPELLRVLRALRARDVDAVIHCGDITDLGYRSEMDIFNSAWQEVMEDDIPLIFALGNRDLSDTDKLSEERRNHDARELIVNSRLGTRGGVAAHLVRGVDIITIDWKHEGELEDFLWQNRELRNPSRPLLVVQHRHQQGTVFDASGWMADDGRAGSCLKLFPNAISISGHSHLGLFRVGSVWRGNYTALAAGSCLVGSAGSSGSHEISILEFHDDHLRLVRENLESGHQTVGLLQIRPWRTIPKKKKNQYAFVQWNLGHFSFGKQGKSSIPGPYSSVRAKAYRQFIATLDADFIGMSEYDSHFDTDGGETPRLLFGDFAAFEAGPHDGYQCNAIAARERALSVPTIVDYRARKQKTYFFETETTIEGERTTLVQTHLDLTLEERTEQIRELVARYGDMKRVIVSGDFNVSSIREYDPFLAAGFRAANGADFGALPTHRRRSMKLTPAIDNIFFRGFVIDEVVAADGSLDFSDHRPLVAQFHLQP